MRCRPAQRKVSHKPQNAKTAVTNVAQPLSFDPGAEPVIQRRAMKSTLNPPNQSVVRLNLVLGRSVRRAQRKASHKAQNAKTAVTNVAQPLSFDPGAEPVIQRRAMKSTLNPPNQSVVRLNLVLGRSVRRAQRKASHKAQNAKTAVTNVAQPLSFDPGAESVIQRRAIMRTLNPPNPSVARPSLLLARSVRIAPALAALNSASLIIIR